MLGRGSLPVVDRRAGASAALGDGRFTGVAPPAVGPAGCGATPRLALSASSSLGFGAPSCLAWAVAGARSRPPQAARVRATRQGCKRDGVITSGWAAGRRVSGRSTDDRRRPVYRSARLLRGSGACAAPHVEERAPVAPRADQPFPLARVPEPEAPPSDAALGHRDAASGTLGHGAGSHRVPHCPLLEWSEGVSRSTHRAALPRRSSPITASPLTRRPPPSPAAPPSRNARPRRLARMPFALPRAGTPNPRAS